MTYSSEGIPSHRLVDLVYLVDVVHLVYPVSLVQPSKQDKPNKPNNSLLPLADFPGILLCQRRKRNQRYKALMNTDPTMTGNPNLKNCQNEMG
jgi:hypothetical protein